jgi:hypothetical protein
MSVLTLEQLQARLTAYLAAETAILQGQEYTITSGDSARRMRRADLAEVRDEIRRLQDEIAAVQAQATPDGGRRVMYLR